MNTARAWLLWASLLLTVAGCNNFQRRPAAQTQPAPPPSRQPVMAVNPAPVAPPPPPDMQPMPPQAGTPFGVPQNVPPGQSGALIGAPQGVPPGQSVSPFPTVPAPGSPNTSGTGLPSSAPIAQVENRWEPSGNGVQLGTPQPIADAKGAPRLYPPDKTAEPPLNSGATALPVGIPQFATAMENVSAGLRPSLDDGLDWLKARGYRTVVFIRLPDENDDPDRKQVEKRGLKYLSLEVSPRTLTKETVREFSRIVGDIPGQPVFLYDRDGALAGGLWYLYFRTAEQCSDDVARVRAGALGLREDRDGNYRDMWLAVQKYLNDTR